MSPKAQLTAFAQQVYLVIKNRRFDDVDSEDGQQWLADNADWINMFIDELESEVDNEGQPVDWKFSRALAFELGTATEGGASIDVPSGMNFLIADENRYVQVLQDGSAVSNWAVVDPKQITNKTDRVTEDMCAQVGDSIVFSRVFKESEAGGTIVGDVTVPIPRVVVKMSADASVLTVTNVKVLSLVVPTLLLTLGVAKNATLPDIVQGSLSPNYAQKYTTLLNNAILRNNASSQADTVVRENYSGIGMV